MNYLPNTVAGDAEVPTPLTLMSDAQFAIWAHQNGLTDTAKKVIHDIRSSPPSRLVGSCRRQSNVSGTFPSRKMGLKLQFESRTFELPFLYLADNDPSVLEIYDQPAPFKISYRNGDRQISHLYTPDFFVLKKNGAGWVELKSLSDLEAGAAKWQGRYVYSEGKWTYPSAEAHAAKLGLTFTIVTEPDLPKTLIRNYGFLNSYYHSQALLEGNKLDRMLSLIAKTPGITIAGLLANNADITSDDLHLAISRNAIYCDLGHTFLGHHEDVHLFTSPVVGEAFLKTVAKTPSSANTPKPATLALAIGGTINVFNKPYQIVDLDSKQVKCVSADGKVLPFDISELLKLGPENVMCPVDTKPEEVANLLSKVRESDLKVANERYDMFKNGSGAHRVTLCTYGRKYREAEAKYGSGYLGLISQDSNKGNRIPRYSQSICILAQTIIRDHYRTKTGRSIKVVYGEFRNACEKNHIVDIPSASWFSKQIKCLPKTKLAAEREGHRVAYQLEGPLDTAGEVLPKHGDFPWHVAHIDHTLADIELLSSETGRNLRRPWLTLMICAFSRKVLAMVVTYDPPSYRSCLLLVRECLRVHSRLPENIVVDNGAEFESIYFTAVCNLFKVTLQTRPPAKPRFGAIIESMFGRINEDFIHNLPGNTKVTKNIRQVTKSTNPKGLAELTLAEFHHRMVGYLNLYHTSLHSGLGTTPEEQYIRGLERFGHRAHLRYPYTDFIRILTLATTAKGTAKVRRGSVRINYIDYTCTKLKDSRFWGEPAPVKYDPWDISIAYVYIDRQWHLCSCGYQAQFRGRSEKQIAIASREIRQGKVLHGRERNITAARLAAFFDSSESEELTMQEDHDRELNILLKGESPRAECQVETPSLPTVSRPSTPIAKEPVPEEDDDSDPPPFKTYTLKS